MLQNNAKIINRKYNHLLGWTCRLHTHQKHSVTTSVTYTTVEKFEVKRQWRHL